MINGKLLDQAICNVARKRFYASLREAMVFSSIETAEVYGEYLNLVNNDEENIKGESRDEP